MRVLGIDPGLALMGYGIVETQGSSQRLLDYGVVSTAAHSPTPSRLRTIYTAINQLMDIYSPDDVAFEELFFSKNVTTGMMVSAARGCALAAVASHTENIYEYTPMQIKQAITGYGKADKRQIQNMVKLLLNMPEIAKPDDAADAIAVAITHVNCLSAKELYRIK